MLPQMSKPGILSLKQMRSYDIIEKDCDFIFHMIYNLCLYAVRIQSYAGPETLLYLGYFTISLNTEVKSLNFT